MSVFLRIPTDEEIADWIASHTPGVWVQQNIVDLENVPAIWLMEFTGAFELRKLTLNFARESAAGVVEDYAQITHHFLNTTGDEPDASWTTGDYEAIETLAEAAWGTLNDFYEPSTILWEHVWTADGPDFKPFGSELHPVLRRTFINAAGTDLGHAKLPPQVSVTVTERTDAQYTVLDVEGVGTQIRNRWGRIYLPAPTTLVMDAGRVSSGFREAARDAYDVFYNSAIAADFLPVMYSPTTGHAWTITEVAVDDLFDVIRSRRYTEVLARTIAPMTY